jgi:transcriptional regulator with GAF, ATPase, and Fis domain
VGHFEAAHGGTLFLDEIGELALPAQVKLLRVVQEGEVRRVGDNTIKRVDVRIIAATNRDLAAEVADGRFREDLFYRLAVLVLKVPPLRDRGGDLGPLVDGLLQRINEQSARAKEPGFKRKKLSTDAKKLLVQHPWPGNIRELENTLRRAAVWSDEDVITGEEIMDSLFLISAPARQENILNRSLEQGVDLQQLIGMVSQHYLRRAIEAAHGNKSRAAEMLGLPSYQTLSNWMRKHGVADDWHGSRR